MAIKFSGSNLGSRFFFFFFFLHFCFGFICFLLNHMLQTSAIAQIYMALKFPGSNPGSEK